MLREKAEDAVNEMQKADIGEYKDG